jgi:transposase
LSHYRIFFGVNGKKLQRHYKKYLVSYSTLEQGQHTANWLLFAKNMKHIFIY